MPGAHSEVKLVNDNAHRLAAVTAAVVTAAAFAKTFLPFYLIGSTPIFAATCGLGAALVAVSRHVVYDKASRVSDILLVLTAFYVLAIASFLVQSYPTVPMTHLAGILIFHALFLVFGLTAARALKAVLLTLVFAGAIYSTVMLQHIVRFGDIVQQGNLQDVFGVGNPAIFATFHQNIGIILGFAALAAVGLASNRVSKIGILGVLPLVALVMFHISARGALVALICSLVFLVGAAFWVSSRKLARTAAFAAIITATLVSGLLYQRAIQDKDLYKATDAFSRTVREIQDPTPGLRVEIWSRTWHRISSEPDRLLFGRGVGMYPVTEGFGAPDWLLRKVEASKHYPHNVYLEMLYEIGIVGLLLFGILTLLPLGIALRRWQLFSLAQKSAISMYVFQLASSQFSGAFAYGYLDQFFFGLTVGIIALNRAGDVLVPGQRVTQGTE